MGDSEGFEIKLKLPDMSQHLTEPLFLLSVIAFVITIIRLILGASSVANMAYLATLFIGFVAAYFVYIYFKEGTKNYWFIGVPVFIFIITLFIFYSGRYPGSMSRDYTIFSIVFGLFLLGYVASMHKIMSLQVAAVLALFMATLIMHLVPAQMSFLSALDPYWYYKWADVIYTTGHLPERDFMTYPMWGGIQKFNPDKESGIDMSVVPLLVPLFMASMATVTKLVGVQLYDVAILYAGIVSALTIIVLYLLIKELFSDMAPYNHIAAMLASFMLMLSPAFAGKAIATNAEDDAMGMFLLVASFLLLVMAFRRRSLKLSLLSGLGFLMLKLSWGGYLYAVIITAIFGILFAIASFVNKKNCLEYIPYILIAIATSLLTPFFLHSQKSMPSLIRFYPGDLIAVAIGGMVFTAVMLEFVRAHMYGQIKIKGKNTLDRIDNLLEENIKSVALGIIVLTIIGIYFIGVGNIYSQVFETIKSAKVHDVIGVTIAEQNPLAGSLNGFLTNAPRRFGIAILYGLIMIPVLLYVGFVKRNFGALFILAWSIPMIYGVYNKSQYLFTASVPIAALGATVGLYAIAKRKDFESFRILGAIFVIITPLAFIPFTGAANYNKFVGMNSLYMGPGGDRIYWDPALVWLGANTPENTAVLTWWDYGHWITSTSKRSVLIDNLQADAYQIQDVARFFVNKTTEEEAYDIVRNYSQIYEAMTQSSPEGVDLNYVVIDWTMIGKGSALHEIATGHIESKTIGSFRNYAHCGFSASDSDPKPRITTKDDGTVTYNQRVVFRCTPAYISYIIFDVSGDSFKVSVMDLYGRTIPWSSWLADNDASILGVQSLRDMLTCALQRERMPPGSICNFPTFNTLVYVPAEFSDFMMTKLYLGQHLAEYKQYGLYNREITPLKHFKLVDAFNGKPDYEGEQDYSSWGYVRVYEIIE